jgi:hypothetical protein
MSNREEKIGDRRELIRGIRELATFLEEHPKAPFPVWPQFDVFVKRGQLRAVAKITSWEKKYYGDWFTLVRTFAGGVSLHVNVSRSEVCRRVVTGTRVEPAKTVETVEWECGDDSILGGTA